MSAVLKGVVLILAGGGASAGGWYLTNFIDKEPYAYTLETGASSLTTTYTDNTKLGGIEANKKILVANIDQNSKWFEWVFKNEYEKIKDDNSKLDTDFQKLEKGYGKDDPKSLSKVCDNYYKKGKNDFSEDKKKNNVKQFCTVGRNKDITIPSAGQQ